MKGSDMIQGKFFGSVLAVGVVDTAGMGYVSIRTIITRWYCERQKVPVDCNAKAVTGSRSKRTFS